MKNLLDKASDLTVSEKLSEPTEVLSFLLDAIETYCPDYMHGIPKSEYVDAAKLAIARLDAKEAEAYSAWLERELAKVAAAFHANFIVKSDTHAHKAFGAGLADLTGGKP